jgi:hypothetical protein
MSKTRGSKLGYIVVGLGLVALAWTLWPSGGADKTARGLDDELINRFWIDHLPTTMTDKIDVLAFVDDPQLGVFQNTSAYEGDFSLFTWSHDGDRKLRVTVLQTEKSYKLKYRVSDEGCGRFDLCVKIKGAPRGAKQYYSMEDWIIESRGDLESQAVRDRLRAAAD